MKLNHSILAMLAAPAALCCAAYAETAPDTIAAYLPCNGTVIPGTVVRPARDVSFVELHKAVIARFAQLPKEIQEAINAKVAPDRLMEYNADLWPDKADYEKYVEAWKKSRLVPLHGVQVGLMDRGEGIYTFIAVTQAQNGATLPLTLATLRYNARKNTWTSNNGELTGQDFSADANYDYGAQTGTEWKLEKKGAFSTINETLRLTKSTDGKQVFMYYGLVDRANSDNVVVANHGYTILFPVTAASANASRPGQK